MRLEKTLSEKTASRKCIISVFLATGIILIFKRRKQMLDEEMMQTLTLQNLDSHGRTQVSSSWEDSHGDLKHS